MKTITKLIICSFLVAFAAVGCVKEEAVLDEFQFELVARMEYEAGTKTSLSGLQGDGMYYPLWSEGDEIAVYAGLTASPVKFSLYGGDGTTEAMFAGNCEVVDPYAFYPYSFVGEIQDGNLSFAMPYKQQYEQDSFGKETYPMVAEWKNGALKFMNLCSVIKISITGEAAIRSITLTAKDTTAMLSGPATVSMGDGSVPELVMGDGGSNSVVLECKGAELSKDTPVDFHIVIPAQTYKGGFEISIDAYTDVFKKNVDADLTFKRSQMRHLKGMELTAEKPNISEMPVPDNEIWYVTKDNTVYDVFQTTYTYGHMPFDANVVSNTYQNGYGIIRFDAPVTKIYDHTFGNSWAEKMTELYLPDCIEYLGTGAITNTGLTTLRIPKNLKTVGSYGLNNPNLESFTGSHITEDGRCVIIEDGFMPDYGSTLTPVKNYMAAFAPAGITEYTLPNNVEVLGWYTFAWCSELRKITFNEGLKTIMDDCFTGTNLDCEIILPSTLEYLASYAFHSCSGIKGFYGNEKFHTSDHLCLIFEQTAYADSEKNGTWIIRFVGYDLTDYSIPEGIKGIENYSFDQMPNLKTVTLPSSLAEVGASAFNHCDNLEALYGECVSDDHKAIVFDTQFRKLLVTKDVVSYTVPDDITTIGYRAFAESPEIETITMGDQISAIEGYAFAECPNLKSITLSAGLKDISGPNAFINSGKLETIYCRALVPPSYNDYQMSEFPNLKFYVPEGSLELYRNHPGWSQYAKYMVGYNYTDLPQPDYYISTDYSQDGTAVQLQKASEGNGINIVLMGDGYSDRQIADGTYKADMEFAYGNLFTKEPYKSFKSLFNVSYVNVVSATEGFEHGNTALAGGFGDGTLVYGNDNTCFNYAQKVVSPEQMDQTLVVVVMNSNRYAGTCYMYYPNASGTDYGTGAAVAYFPKGEEEEVFAQLLHHEANGHGFSKLADEYAYEYMGTIPAEEAEQTRTQQEIYGWWKNVDFTNDPAQVRWKKFLDDSRYANQGLGVFEGGLTYWSGVWRPTENSIMRHNTGEFNAPSREAIYYRIHKLAYGTSWQYDYEKFVEWDAVNRKASSGAYREHVTPLKPSQRLHPPVVVGKHWSEAAENTK